MKATENMLLSLNTLQGDMLALDGCPDLDWPGWAHELNIPAFDFISLGTAAFLVHTDQGALGVHELDISLAKWRMLCEAMNVWCKAVREEAKARTGDLATLEHNFASLTVTGPA